MSYEYLQRDDAVPVSLAKEVDRIEERTVELNPDEEARAMRLHRESIIIDFHNHLYVLPENIEKDLETYARAGRIATGFEGLRKAGLTACLYAVGGLLARRSSPVAWQFRDLVWDMGMRQADMDHHQDVVMRAYGVKDIHEAQKSGKTAVFLHVENGGVIGNDLDRVDVLYGLGLRCMGLSYNSRTFIADGATEDRDGGLSKFGLKVIERMNRLGMLIDFSHSSELSTTEGVQASEAPCCLTHAIAKGVFDNPKGKSDKVMELLASRGGVIGVEAVPNITSDKDVQTVFDVLDHIDYLVRLVGVDHVAVGTDTMFGDHVAFHKVIAKPSGLGGLIKAFRADHMEYIENPGQIPNLTRALVTRGYTDQDIKRIMGENVLRLLSQTMG